MYVISITRGISIINVLEFGLKGDGSRDNSIALISLLSAIPKSGCSICFPQGVYRFMQNVQFPTYISIIMENGAILCPDLNVTLTLKIIFFEQI